MKLCVSRKEVSTHLWNCQNKIKKLWCLEKHSVLVYSLMHKKITSSSTTPSLVDEHITKTRIIQARYTCELGCAHADRVNQSTLCDLDSMLLLPLNPNKVLFKQNIELWCLKKYSEFVLSLIHNKYGVNTYLWNCQNKIKKLWCLEKHSVLVYSLMHKKITSSSTTPSLVDEHITKTRIIQARYTCELGCAHADRVNQSTLCDLDSMLLLPLNPNKVLFKQNIELWCLKKYSEFVLSLMHNKYGVSTYLWNCQNKIKLWCLEKHSVLVYSLMQNKNILLL